MGEEHSIKLVLLGDSGVGKSTIVTRYVSGNVITDLHPTVGAACIDKEISIEGRNVILRIWDTAGQEIYRSLAPMYYRNAPIAIIVYDITHEASFEAVSYWLRELQANVEKSVVIVICGNKTDLEDRRLIAFTKGSSLASERGALFVESSAFTNMGIERLFQLAVSSYLKRAEGNSMRQMASGNANMNTNQSSQSSCC
jgi:Rab family protein